MNEIFPRKVIIMASLLKSTLNTRFLPTGNMRFLRSDAPLQLTDAEINWLLENGITTLVDLRSPEETERKPCPLAAHPAFSYHFLPVTGGGDTPLSRAHLHETYRNMIDGRMAQILDVIFAAPAGVMYFCTAGKDRTGVVSALLLKKLGADEETIVQDYMLSKGNLMDMLLSYASAHPEVNPDIIIPREENIQNILEHMNRLEKFSRLETERLVLRKARKDDLEAIWQNVWSDAEVAQTMLWQPTLTREEALRRMERTISLQSLHFTYFVCLKETDEPIGFGGIREVAPGVFDEMGLCIARAHQRKGYAKEMLEALVSLALDKLGGHTFLYSCFRENTPSASLCKALGFQYTHTDTGTRGWDGYPYTCDHFELKR